MSDIIDAGDVGGEGIATSPRMDFSRFDDGNVGLIRHYNHGSRSLQRELRYRWSELYATITTNTPKRTTK